MDRYEVGQLLSNVQQQLARKWRATPPEGQVTDTCNALIRLPDGAYCIKDKGHPGPCKAGPFWAHTNRSERCPTVMGGIGSDTQCKLDKGHLGPCSRV